MLSILGTTALGQMLSHEVNVIVMRQKMKIELSSFSIMNYYPSVTENFDIRNKIIFFLLGEGVNVNIFFNIYHLIFMFK